SVPPGVHDRRELVLHWAIEAPDRDNRIATDRTEVAGAPERLPADGDGDPGAVVYRYSGFRTLGATRSEQRDATRQQGHGAVAREPPVPHHYPASGPPSLGTSAIRARTFSSGSRKNASQ